ncbi:MAG: response regulator [Campylobacterota bacterium]|nr:response regulator [Campylobacterota bacterium]
MEKVELEDLIVFSRTIKVLYVEGESKLRESAHGVFKIFFESIDTAKNGRDGYEQFLNNKYNLIITDINMSEMNGMEMISKIREVSKDITILIISSVDDKEYFMDLIKLGVDGYILKPVKVKQFVEVLQKVIEKFQNKQKLFEYKNNLEDIINEKTKELQQTNQELIDKKEQLELLNLSLEQQVKEEVQKNILKEKQLFEQSKMASMGEMIGNIAHQWRQPLSAITTSVGSIQLQKDLGILEDDDLNKICTLIQDNSIYLSNTIEDFRNFFKDKKDKELFNLKAAIEELLNLVSPTIKGSFIDVHTDIDEDIMINGFKNELNQSLMNLINNANDILYNIEGERFIYLKGYKQDDNVVLIFQDNGGGINDGIINRIFEPYFTTKHKSQGTGLGLNMTYKLIVESMDGNITVSNSEHCFDNKLYKGARFQITLPLS